MTRRSVHARAPRRNPLSWIMASPFPFAFFTPLLARPVASGLSLALALSAAWLAGGYMAAAFSGRERLLGPVLDPLVRATQRLAGPHAQTPMRWHQAALAAVGCSCLLFLLVYGAGIAQGHAAAQAFTRAARAVAGDPSELSGPLRGAAFVGAGATLALCVAILRALRSHDGQVGNYWRDLSVALICVLTPLACLHTAVTSSTGVVTVLAAWRGGAIPGAGQVAAQVLRSQPDAVTGLTALAAPASLVSLFAHLGRRRLPGFIACAAALALTLAAQRLPEVTPPALTALPWLAALLQLILHFWLAIPALALAAAPGLRRLRAAEASS
jgi:hypothetical protein